MMIRTLSLAGVALALSACAGMSGTAGTSGMSGTAGTSSMSGTASPQSTMYSQAMLPDAVKVPAGHRVVMETVGVGEITYECRAKAAMAGQYEWVFVGPDAALMDRKGSMVGKYYGPPATWESRDGSKLTGAQVAVAPAQPGSIPLQLVKANPAMGMGAMNGVTYIQRVQTKGGVAPAMACGMDTMGRKEIVKYQADYIFWGGA
jgi:hypothetical protein